MSDRSLSLSITLIYFALGSFYLLLTAHIDLNSSLDSILFILFLPATFFPFAYLFTERDPWTAIILTQTVIFLILWAIVHFHVYLLRSVRNGSQNS